MCVSGGLRGKRRCEEKAPCPAEGDVGDAILVAKAELEGPVLVKLAAVEAQVFLQRLGDELPLVERGLCFSRHFGFGRGMDSSMSVNGLGSQGAQVVCCLEGHGSAANDR